MLIFTPTLNEIDAESTDGCVRISAISAKWTRGAGQASFCAVKGICPNPLPKDDNIDKSEQFS